LPNGRPIVTRSDPRIEQIAKAQALHQVPLTVVLDDLCEVQISEIHGVFSEALSYLERLGFVGDRTCHEWPFRQE